MPKIRTAQLELTERCNYLCSYCYNPPHTSSELDLTDWQKIIRKLRDYGVERIILTGGEPLLRPDLVEGLEWDSINTNLSRGLTISGKDVNVAIPSFNPILYNHITGGDLSTVLENLRKLDHFYIHMVVTQQNKTKVYETGIVASELGASKFFVSPIADCMLRPEQLPLSLNLTEKIQILDELLEIKKETGMGVDVLTVLTNLPRDKYSIFMKRTCPGNWIYVRRNGDITRCMASQEILNNALHDSIEEVLTAEFENNQLGITEESCGGCHGN